MKRNQIRHPFVAALLTSLLVLDLSGCGGGADDPTSVALRPSKVQPTGGGPENGTVPPPNGPPPPNGVPPEGFGGITGRIVIAETDKGNVPPPTITLFGVGRAPVDAMFCAREMAIPNESLVVNPMSLGLKNTFFYLERAPRRGKSEIESQSAWPTADEDGEKLVMDQINCTFVPHAMIVIANQPFLVQSQDAVGHTYRGSPPSSGAFNLGIPPPTAGGIPGSLEVNVFRKAERSPVPISCATHSWMSGYQLPLDHPYAAVTDNDGRFTISDLPSGSHKFTIWHELGGKIRNYDVDVKADETVDLGDIAIRLNQLNR